MKRSKKAITALAFTLGACVFLSTAFADAMLGSGYDRLKSSAKLTAAQMEKGLGSYTVEALFTLKEQDQTLLQATMHNKIDTEKQASETTTTTHYASGQTTSSYFYGDNKQTIWKSELDDRYYVTELPDDLPRGSRSSFSNPFEEEGATEIEKIVDAVVGSLKDNVQAEERTDGGKLYSGSLSEAQVPALVNAVASFGAKQMLGDHRHMQKEIKLPEIHSDIFIKKVTGSAAESKTGLLENVTGEVILSGKDKNGAAHDLTLNVVVKLTNIGSTKIAAPDLTGANVEKVSSAGGFSSKYIGTYKNNIVMEKNGKFVKIGERTLVITHVEKGKVSGKYVESVKPGFEAEYPEPYNITFEYNPTSSTDTMPTFTYTNAKGEQEKGQLHPGGIGKIYVDLNIEVLDGNSYKSNHRPNYDGEFTRVFEE